MTITPRIRPPLAGMTACRRLAATLVCGLVLPLAAQSVPLSQAAAPNAQAAAAPVGLALAGQQPAGGLAPSAGTATLPAGGTSPAAGSMPDQDAALPGSAASVPNPAQATSPAGPTWPDLSVEAVPAGIPADLLLPESVFVRIDGRLIHCLDFAPPPGQTRGLVVLIPGYGGFAAESLSIGRRLRDQGLRLLAPDMPGSGLSPGFAVCPGMEGYTAFTGQVLAWAAGLLPADAPVPLVAAAHSTGAQMLLLNALDWRAGFYGPADAAVLPGSSLHLPEATTPAQTTATPAPAGLPDRLHPVARAWNRVSGIFLLAPNGMKGEEGPLMGLRSRWVMDVAHGLYSPAFFNYLMDVQVHYNSRNVDPLIGRLGARYLQLPGAWDCMVDYLLGVMGNDSLDGRLGPVTLPVKILWGRQDQVLRFDWHRQFLASLPQAELLAIDGCGHGIHHEQPDLVVRELLAFMEPGLGRAGGPPGTGKAVNSM